MSKLLRGVLLLLVATGLTGFATAQGPVHTPRVHALTNARIITAPGQVIENGTIVIRDGLIEAVGAGVTPPPDAWVHDLDSLWVYPGLIDAGMRISPRESEEEDDVETLAHELSAVRPEFVLADAMPLDDSAREARRAAGITTVRALPKGATFSGQAAVLNLGDGGLGGNLLTRSAGQTVAFKGAGGDEYPGSTMGVVAVIRQTLSDARWYADTRAAYAAGPRGLERPKINAAWEAMAPAMAGDTPFVFHTRNMLDLLRADGIAREFDVSFEYLGSGEEYKRIDEIQAATKRLILPVNFPKAPSVGSTPGEELAVTTESLRAWDNAPRNPDRVYRAGIEIAFTAEGLKDVGMFRENVARAIDAGLPREAALAACTTVPAKMLGLEDQAGTIERGMLANLVVTDGELFADSTGVRTVWVDGDEYEVAEIEAPEGDPRGVWEFVAMAGGQEYPGKLVIKGEIGALKASIETMGEPSEAKVIQSGGTLLVSYTSAAVGDISMTLSFKGDSGNGSGDSPYGPFSVTMTRTESFGDTPGGSR